MPQKTVLITGCSDGGIGAALASEFQQRGLRVLATSRNKSKMASLAAKGIETLQLDVTSEESITKAVSQVKEKLGPAKLDILVNNAGVQHVLPLADAKIADLRAVLDTNILGSLAVTQAFIPLLMRTTDSDSDRAVVVMLGSVNEVFSPPYQCAYNASKAAVHALARTLRVELAPLGIHCVTLMTGSVRSKLFDNAPASKVPADSLYAAVAGSIESREMLRNAQWIDAEEFARQVADELLKARPKLDIWRGGLARVASWLGWLGWEGMLDSTIFKANHLDQVRANP